MENKPNEVVLVKIPLKHLIDTLVMIYSDGADYVDIVGVPNEMQDSIGIVVRDEYMAKDDGEDNGSQEEGGVSETDLNDLV